MARPPGCRRSWKRWKLRPASSRCLHHYPVSTEPEEMWEHGNVMLGFDAEERLILKLPQDFADKVVWGSRYPHHDATSAWDASPVARCQCAGAADRPHDGAERGRSIWHRDDPPGGWRSSPRG